MDTNYVSSIFSTLQALLLLKATFSADGAIYFGEKAFMSYESKYLLLAPVAVNKLPVL